MSDKTIENQIVKNLCVFTMRNELQIDGHHLIEKKQKTHNRSSKFVVERVHIRSIDNKSYKITETMGIYPAFPNVEIETEMTEDEVKKFKEDWKNLWNQWNPDITNNNELNFSLDI